MEKGSCNLLPAWLKANYPTFIEEYCVSALNYMLVGLKCFSAFSHKQLYQQIKSRQKASGRAFPRNIVLLWSIGYAYKTSLVYYLWCLVSDGARIFRLCSSSMSLLGFLLLKNKISTLFAFSAYTYLHCRPVKEACHLCIYKVTRRHNWRGMFMSHYM